MTQTPRFRFGNCMMLERLSKPEVEYLGPLLVERLKRLELQMPLLKTSREEREDFLQEIRRLQGILIKIDYPFRSVVK